MRFRKIFLVLPLFLFLQTAMAQLAFDIQGHRGCRGLMPENTIPAFKKALDLGVTTLELDVVVSKDHQLVVSHEPFFSGSICLTPGGQKIPPGEEKTHNLYQLTYDEIKGYDCGSPGNPRFPEQTKMAVHKPLLREVITQMETYRQDQHFPLFAYNIEIKSTPAGDNVFHPAPETFSDLVYREIRAQLPFNRVILQSFDFRVLKYWHQQYPEVVLAALVEKPRTIENLVKELGFTPAIYSPHYKLLPDEQTVRHARQLGMKVIPWTVNEIADMRQLKSWGVDGLITDYPDRALTIRK